MANDLRAAEHKQYMKIALDLARQAEGYTSPNPLVGAVIVKNGEIVGKGYHQKAGTPHAEIHALRQAGAQAQGATLYVTLEPCSHHGRTGPCCQAVVEAGITEVYVAMTDPNPLVAGQGNAFLQQHGVKVHTGLFAEQAAKLNEVFIKWIHTKLPFTVVKSAMTLDGKIATANGKSQWISNEISRHKAHELRHIYDGILVGVNTVIKDDPLLTVRLPELKSLNQPTRIIVDSTGRTPLDAKILSDKTATTLIAATPRISAERIRDYESKGAKVLIIPEQDGHVHLRALWEELGRREITSLLVEGGGEINASLFEQNLVDKVCWFIGPKIFGGAKAQSPVAGKGVQNVSDAYELEDIEVQNLAGDLLIQGYVKSREGRHVYRTCGRIGTC